MSRLQHRAAPACILDALSGVSVLMLQVRLAKEAREFAVVAMEKEPQDDLAQHLMGRQAPPYCLLGHLQSLYSLWAFSATMLQTCLAHQAAPQAYAAFDARLPGASILQCNACQVGMRMRMTLNIAANILAYNAWVKFHGGHIQPA